MSLGFGFSPQGTDDLALTLDKMTPIVGGKASLALPSPWGEGEGEGGISQILVALDLEVRAPGARVFYPQNGG
jgi:hypothetical protein